MEEKNQAISARARIRIDNHLQGQASTLAEDVLRGLYLPQVAPAEQDASRPAGFLTDFPDGARLTRPRPRRQLPPKHFYDDRGSELFDRICETAEYYPTRTELQLLETIAPALIDAVRPTDLVELGSGSPRKARMLLAAAQRCGVRCRYVPFDVSEGALRQSAALLLGDFPWLEIHGVVGDYDQHLGRIPRGERSLYLFLGGTIGNFEEGAGAAFLRRLRDAMSPEDRLLLGSDIVKDAEVLHRAYNDAEGLTAEFNKNVLRVINRDLGGRFDPERFRHVAFYDAESQRVEMHLESTVDQKVPIRTLGIELEFGAGERILTEISRKFTRDSVTALLARAGLALTSWYEPPNGAFALSVSQPA